nr:MAG TPA: hypothetical protein [Caudoviricetes sp.]
MFFSNFVYHICVRLSDTHKVTSLTIPFTKRKSMKFI